VSLVQRLDALCDHLTVLKHPFYQRWERGELTREELSYYAGEYRHAVQALADVATASSTPDHGAEERAHVALWDDFAGALGAESGRSPRGETIACVESWKDESEPLGVLYAVEATQPAIARTKHEGLIRHYGFEPGSRDVEYFTVHAERDVEHAAQTRARLEQLPPEREGAVLAAAERALRGNWTLLDGIDRVARAA
jgi:pyrroloquinoline-quinone synthase